MNIDNIARVNTVIINKKMRDMSIDSCFFFVLLGVNLMNYFLNTMDMVLFQRFLI